ncbi:hypothetical protein AVEN_128187-1 [Araneus ventricosus]|uniref:Uncharacterized protein n=1 Tax=Araneus ventricosus TaxID=182803 RepID=A0A4Y1ZZS2_ARAVE|nr:hypothetical protein AVEN_128187-1 [Araneus ventricosus]
MVPLLCFIVFRLRVFPVFVLSLSVSFLNEKAKLRGARFAESEASDTFLSQKNLPGAHFQCRRHCVLNLPFGGEVTLRLFRGVSRHFEPKSGMSMTPEPTTILQTSIPHQREDPWTTAYLKCIMRYTLSHTGQIFGIFGFRSHELPEWVPKPRLTASQHGPDYYRNCIPA